jgi:5-methyltetrahydrofolate--homocysteine methyltransferase
MDLLQELNENIQKGKLNEAVELTKKALSDGMSPSQILDDALIPGMGVVGEKFKNNEIFVPEMLIAARAMNGALGILEPEMIKANVEAKGKILIGTVKGDLHDIGKNLVTIMFKGAGYKVIDLGVDVSADAFVEAAKKEEPDFIGLSALLTTTMVNMKEVVEKLKAASLQTKIIIGGAPVTESFAKEIEADGYAGDAASAVDVAKELAA